MRIPGTAPSGFGRSVRAPHIGTVNPRRHPKAVEPRRHQGRPGEQRGPGTAMLAVGRVHTLYKRGQLTRIPGATPSGFGRSVHAPRIGTVNPRRHPKAVEPRCHQDKQGEQRGSGTVMLAVGRVHSLYTLGQLTRIPGAAPSGFGRSVRAPRIGTLCRCDSLAGGTPRTLACQTQMSASWSSMLQKNMALRRPPAQRERSPRFRWGPSALSWNTQVRQHVRLRSNSAVVERVEWKGGEGESRCPGTVMLAVGRVHTLCMLGQLTRIPGTASSDFGRSARAPRIGTVNPHRQPKAPRGASLSPR